MYRKTASITVTALAADASEEYEIADPQARVGDVICINATAGNEDGWIVQNAYVSAHGVITVVGANRETGSLTGATVTLRYANIR